MSSPRITIEPDKMGGAPCIRGLRMPVATVLAMLAQSVPHEQILREHPDLEPEDLGAALEFLASALRQARVELEYEAGVLAREFRELDGVLARTLALVEKGEVARAAKHLPGACDREFELLGECEYVGHVANLLGIDEVPTEP